MSERLFQHASEIIALAREAERYRALRPTCPTCDGEGVDFCADDDDIGDVCPDCTDGDGRMPLDQWVARLAHTLWNEHHNSSHSFRHAADECDTCEVLKMAGILP